jgi:putative ABC transport system substrate-binding protein
MKRREALAVLAAGVAWPLAAKAQPAKVARIGYLGGSSRDQARRVLAAFHKRLQELGHLEGGSIAIDWRFADGDNERLPRLAAELVEANPDLIVAGPTPAALAAKNATQTIPIVMIAAGDPVALGWMESLSRPPANVTGMTFTVGVETFAKNLELLREIAPDVRLFAVLVNSTDSPLMPLVTERIQAAARSMAVRLQWLEAAGPEDFDRAFADIEKERAGALLVIANNNFMRGASRLAELAIEKRLPSIAQLRVTTEAGTLMSYGPSAVEQWARGAEYVDRILRGAQPADLPVQQPTRFELLINLKTAKALGLTVPPTLLARADEVIE